MSDATDQRELVDRLAEEFVRRYRNGERPSLAEYVAAHPDHAAEIRELFPALVVMEELAPGDDSMAGAAAGRPAVRKAGPRQRVGDFSLLREIGRGGMGVVYEAEQLSLGRRVALKLFGLPPGTDDTALERFRREARSAAQLHHTNIVPVFDVGQDGDVCYYAMQLIHGQGLDEVIKELRRLRDGSQGGRPGREPPTAGTVAQSLLTGQFRVPQLATPLDQGPGPAADAAVTMARPEDPARPLDSTAPLAKGPASAVTLHGQPDLSASGADSWRYYQSVARVGVQAAEALAHAHQRGIVHRDVKPSNLLLDTAGVVWVADFGLAKTEECGLTVTGDLVGTIRYMAPERFRGQCDARADVYGLGLTLYELLTLRPAFDDPDRLRLVERIGHQEPPRPRALDPRVPRDLETVVLKALDKEPGRRYPTAQELADDLRRFLEDRPVRARRTSVAERGWRWCRRNPALALAVGSVAGMVVAVAVVASLAAYSSRRQLQQTRQAQDEARHRLYGALVSQARAGRLGRRVGQRFESLQALDEAARIARELNLPAPDYRDELRNEVIACLALPDARAVQEWDGWPADGAHVDFDGNLERYARVDGLGNVSVRRVAPDEELCHFVSALGSGWPRLSPRGRFLGIERPPRFELWKVDGPEAGPLLREPACTASDFSPDGRQVVVVNPEGTISLYDLPSGRPVRQLQPGPHPIHFAAFHPDGRRLAVSHAGGVQVRDLDTGDVLADLPQAGAEHLAWHPGGKTLAVVGDDQVIHLWDVTARREFGGLRRWKNGGLRITFSHAGDLLASVGWEQMLRLWDPRAGEELFHMPASFTGAPPRFRADDRLLAADVKENKFRLWDVAPGRECRRLFRNPSHGKAPYGPLTVSPDGRVLAARTPDGFGLWGLRPGQPLASVSFGPLDDVLFEPSGALLTAGPDGIFRWPFRPDPASAGVMRLGPPRRLPLPGTAGTQIAASADGRVVASAHRWGALVLDADHPDRPVRLEPQEDAGAVAVSPDGRWVATGSQTGAGVKVWDVRTGEPVRELVPQEDGVRVGFSPDGRWLATRGSGLRLWAVGTWQDGPVLSGVPGPAFAFSPAENLLATETGYAAVRLVEPETGREWARLEDPDQVRVTWTSFSPDGTQLLTSGGGDAAWIRVWDLRAIRAELAQRGLDWDLPPYPPAGAAEDAPKLRVEVDLGDLTPRGPP